MEIDDIIGIIINNAMEIHKKLGPRLLELVYEAVLFKKLEKEGLKRVINNYAPSASPRLRVNQKDTV
ncbi:MAG: hypothetical protein NUV76_05575 [Candidatus Kuenenia sp.]|nr:hypothetical protein [Candidatus Kuenenia sp.]